MAFQRARTVHGILAAACLLAAGDGRRILEPVRVGEICEGFLRQSDWIGGAVPNVRPEWTFHGAAGQQVTVSAMSLELNPFLVLLDPRGHQIAWDDDSGWFFNARMRIVLPASGQYTVLVRGVDADQQGSYWLSIEPGHREAPTRDVDVAAYYKRGTRLAAREGNLRAIGWLNLAAGNWMRDRQRCALAENFYAVSRMAAARPGFLYGMWAVALERSTLLAQQLRYDRAVAELERARRLGERLESVHAARAAVATRLGDLYRYMGRAELANVYYREAVIEDTAAGLTPNRARLYGSLSLINLSRDRKQAREYAATAYAAAQGADPTIKLAAAGTLAEAYFASGRLDDAMHLVREARQAARGLGCSDQEVAMLSTESVIRYSLGDIDGMIASASEAVAITSEDAADPNPRRAALQLQAEGEARKGNHEKALLLWRQALHTTEKAWELESIPELRQRFLALSNSICTQIVGSLEMMNRKQPRTDVASEAFDLVERSHCRGLLEEIAIARSCPDADTQRPGSNLDRLLVGAISEAGKQAALVTADLLPAGLDRLEGQRAALVSRQLQTRGYSPRSDSRVPALSDHPALLTAEEVRRKLIETSPNSAILSYQLGNQAGYLVVLTASQSGLFKLPGWSAIREMVLQWRAEILQQQGEPGIRGGTEVQAYGRIAHRIYTTLVEPAASLIRGKDLVIVPGKALRDLAFEALVVESPSGARDYRALRYLVEEHAIGYAPSISVVDEIERAGGRSDPTGGMLLAGDAVFSPRDQRASAPDSATAVAATAGSMSQAVRLRAGLHRLPATRDEVVQVARLAAENRWSTRVLLDFDASEQNVKTESLSPYRILHFATHATADSVDGSFSGVVLSMCGGQAGEDGLLTAAEIVRLRLNADLVVLSGCSTGGGEATDGEGVIGLSRAFLVAGARSVCASLWNVEDDSTQRLMTSFYSHLLSEGLSAPSAMRLAKLGLIRAGEPPFDWAPFTLVGDQ